MSEVWNQRDPVTTVHVKELIAKFFKFVQSLTNRSLKLEGMSLA